MLGRLKAERRAAIAPAFPPRDPQLASLWGYSAMSSAGVTVTPDTARRCPEVDACVGLIEDTVATLPLDLYQRVDSDQRQRRDDDPLHVLLHDRPNDWQTSAEWRQMMEGYRQTYGDAYSQIIPAATGIKSLEPMHPLDVWPFRRPDGSVAYRWSPPGTSPVTLLADEVLHVRDHPFRRDLIRGESKVERHRETIGAALATGEYLARFFSNGAVPKTFLVIPPGQNLADDQSKELREQFERRHGGLDNAHRIGVLNAGVDIKAIGVDNEKAQVIQSYARLVAQIARIWGIPPHLIGEMTNSTSWGTGIEQQSIGFVVYYMRPKLVAWEQALNRALMSRARQQQFYFEFNVDGLLRGDFKSRMDGYALMIQWGLATANEIRRQMNLPPMDGGDERLTPLNMVPATRIMDVLLRNGAGAGAPGGVRYLDPDELTRFLAQIVHAANRGQKLELAA
jgi:HK97 family phage portal protein